jgi:YgiT-type zinc finger domain-containing protein
MVPVTENVTFHVGGRTHRFEAVAHERCAACGERIFGLEASRRFDEAILPRRRRAAVPS